MRYRTRKDPQSSEKEASHAIGAKGDRKTFAVNAGSDSDSKLVLNYRFQECGGWIAFPLRRACFWIAIVLLGVLVRLPRFLRGLGYCFEGDF